jgi:very-short-patch-repair endonuclease
MLIAKSRSCSPLLASRAHAMRFEPSDSEQALWRAIQAKKLGVVFRRQVPIGRFIVDFLARSARLIVEVDGGYHGRRRSADARRDEWLRRAGYRVLRLDAELVIRDLAVAVARIAEKLASEE